MFYVDVIRFAPYHETLSYDFEDYESALAFAQKEYNMFGVDYVCIYDENIKQQMEVTK